MPSISSVALAGRWDRSTSLMISSFSDAGYLILRLPHPRACFFEKAQLQRLLSNKLLQITCLPAQVLHLVSGCRTSRIAGKPALAGLHELLRPCVIQALGNAFLAAQLGNAVIAAQAFQHDPYLLFR